MKLKNEHYKTLRMLNYRSIKSKDCSGLDDIRNTHVWEVDEQPAVNEIFEATPEQILVNGELIVHRDDIITEQDILDRSESDAFSKCLYTINDYF